MEVILTALLALGGASRQPAAATPPPTVLFMCPHGAAKSLMASAYFQQRARERGLNVRVDSAGTEPDPQLSKSVVAYLEKHQYAIPIEKPRAATAADMRGADVVISMGCDLSKLPPPKGVVKHWNVPDFSKDFNAAEYAIRQQVNQLVEELLQRQ